MAAVQSAEHLNESLHNCLALCYNAASPLASLAESLAILRTTEGWSREDLDSLRSLVVRMLTRSNGQDQSSDDF